MAESKQHADESVKAPHLIETATDETEAVLHTKQKDSYGLISGIDENTSSKDVKAPNLLRSPKEEIEAVSHTIHTEIETKINYIREKVDSDSDSDSDSEWDSSDSEDDVKDNALNLVKKAKGIINNEKSPQKNHHKETHGRSDDIDVNTPIDEVRGPSIFARAKEEVEAIVQTIHHEKESDNVVVSAPKNGGAFSNSVSGTENEGGFVASVGRVLEKVCSPVKGLGASIGRGLEKVCCPCDTKKD